MTSSFLFLTLALLGAQDPPAGTTATVQTCLDSAAAARADCRAVLEAEAALAPDRLFYSPETSATLLEAWLRETCAPGRLQGRSTDGCRSEAQAQFERSRVARAALAADPSSGAPVRSTAADWGFADGVRPATAAPRRPDAEPETCQRRGAERRDNDTGARTSDYAVSCSWGNGDGSASRGALDALRDED